MAISDTKKDLLLGQSVGTQVKNANDNFNTLFDNDDDLQSQINAVNKPNGADTLIDNNKIRTVYLPDTVLGQLYYQDTFDATTGVTGYTAKRGDYYICNVAGSKNPDGTAASKDYAVGDWAVYNGTKWDKVDNTDAVTMVNGQIGSVKTYKGAYANSTKYYQGDIVLHDSCLYLYINGTAASGNAPTNATYWKIFGKIYSTATTTSDGLMSKEDKAAVHTHSNKALLDTYTQTEANIKDAVNKKHSHSNKTLLDTYDQTNTNIKDAVTKKHSHSNKTVLDGTTASYTTEEKTKLGNIDDSLLGVTADQIGKVKDVKVNGTSVLDETTGVAAITVADLAAGFVDVATTDSVWTTKDVNGTTYQAIKVAKTDTALGVFNSDNQEIVVQKVYDDNYLYLCVGTAKIACTIRKLSGGAVGGGSGESVEITQETGASETAVMSQKAVTDAINAAVDFEYTLVATSTVSSGALSFSAANIKPVGQDANLSNCAGLYVLRMPSTAALLWVAPFAFDNEMFAVYSYGSYLTTNSVKTKGQIAITVSGGSFLVNAVATDDPLGEGLKASLYKINRL